MLMKSFLSDNEEAFNEKFKQIISEVPNRVANKEGFWTYFFLGSLLTLPAARLADELKITK